MEGLIYNFKIGICKQVVWTQQFDHSEKTACNKESENTDVQSTTGYLWPKKTNLGLWKGKGEKGHCRRTKRWQ